MSELSKVTPESWEAHIVEAEIKTLICRLETALEERDSQKIQDAIGLMKLVNFRLSIWLRQPRPREEYFLRTISLGAERSLYAAIDDYERDDFFGAFLSPEMPCSKPAGR